MAQTHMASPSWPIFSMQRNLLQEEGGNVTANALHPGCIETGLGSMKGYHVIKRIFFIIAARFAKSIPQGAGTLCYVATTPALNGVSGKYFQDFNEWSTLSQANDM